MQATLDIGILGYLSKQYPNIQIPQYHLPMTKLVLQLLGQPHLWLDGLDLAGLLPKKAQAILIYLAVTGQPQERGWLAAMLWPDVPDSTALKNLRDILPGLRQVMGEHLLVTRQTLALDGTRPYTLDLETFQTLLQLEPQTMDNLLTALNLYRGDFLQGFYVPHAAPFAEWQELWQERLHETAVQQMDALAEHCLGQQRWETGLVVTQRLLTLEPWRESAHRQRMLLFAHSGQRQSALAQYELCRRTLAAEFGIEPMAQTQALYRQIMAGELGVTAVPAIVTSPARHNLPRPLTPFFGREAELAQLAEKLCHPEYPLVTVMGEGGMGKTRLALAAARQVLPCFADGVWFVSLTKIPPETEPAIAAERLAEAIAQATGIPFVGQSQPAAQLGQRLRARHMLLVLDNFEHLMAGAPFVLELLQACPQLTVLLASRERLNVQAEWVVRLQGLPVPPDTPTAVANMTAVSSIQLFTERASRAAPHFILEARNLADVARICRLVAGLPLGIELAAALMAYQTSATIAAALQEGYAALSTSLPDLPTRHHSLRAVFDYSWGLLPPEEAQTLAQCAVFQDGFTETAGQTILQTPRTHLAALVRKSLLRQRGDGRFDMHELIRHFAAEKLAARPELYSQTRHAHADFYAAFVQTRQEQLENETAVLQEIQSELGNIRAAWQQATDTLRLPALAQSLQGLSLFYRVVGLFREAFEVFAKTISQMRRAIETADRQTEYVRLLGHLLVEQGFFCEKVASTETAVTLAQEAITIGEQLADPILLAQATIRLAAIQFSQGNMIASYANTEKGLALAQRTGQSRLEVVSLSGLGVILLNQNELEKALLYQTRALAGAQKHRYRRLEGVILANMGALCRISGRISQAMHYLQALLQIGHEFHDLDNEALTLFYMGELWLTVGDYEAAQRLLTEALRLYREIGNRPNENSALISLAAVCYRLGDGARARQFCAEALQVAQEIGLIIGEGEAWLMQGQLEWRQGRLAAARQAMEKGVARLAGSDSPAYWAGCACLGQICLVMGEVGTAVTHLNNLLPRLPTLPHNPPVGDIFIAYVAAYEVLTAVNDPRAAVLLAEAKGRLAETAVKIEDERQRQLFLAIEEHRRLRKLEIRN
jgi:predicted ATPase/DNA-binding SARP family transcriptional activator